MRTCVSEVSYGYVAQLAQCPYPSVSWDVTIKGVIWEVREIAQLLKCWLYSIRTQLQPLSTHLIGECGVTCL